MKGPLFVRAGAFTLIELMVVIGIISILAAVITPVIGSVRREAGMTREISSARQLMAAYLAYSSDHDGEVLPGFGDFPATDDRGQAMHHPVNARYPWRLAPYLGYEMRLFWGRDADDRLRKLASGPHDAYAYAISVQPALGINAAYVGGDFQVLPPNKEKLASMYGAFCVTRLAQAVSPHQLIVLASAGGGSGSDRLSGYFKVEAPNFTARRWSESYSSSASPEEFGYVDFRWEKRAVAAMLDGHVELLDFERMNDMRRWSNQAGSANDPTWKLGMPDSSTYPPN